MTTIIRPLAVVAPLLLWTAQAHALVISDDFEADAVGAFPAMWLDVGAIDPASTAPDPSAQVVATTDAFGAPTQALRIPDAFASSQGIYAEFPGTRRTRIGVDFRIDQFSDNAGFTASDWALDFGLIQRQGTTDFAFTPALQVYVSSFDQAWHGFYVGTDAASGFPDFGLGVATGTWYHVDLELHPLAGMVRTVVSDIALGTTLLDRTDVIAGWTASDGQFDAVGFFDGELTAAATVGNVTLIDNIRVSTVPAPAALALLLLGLGVAAAGRGGQLASRKAVPPPSAAG